MILLGFVALIAGLQNLLEEDIVAGNKCIAEYPFTGSLQNIERSCDLRVSLRLLRLGQDLDHCLMISPQGIVIVPECLDLSLQGLDRSIHGHDRSV